MSNPSASAGGERDGSPSQGPNEEAAVERRAPQSGTEGEPGGAPEDGAHFCAADFPQIGRHPYEIIAFDWDGTAVVDRRADATDVTLELDGLLKYGVYVVVITGTKLENVDAQFSSRISGQEKQNLFICTNRGSEVWGFDVAGRPDLLYKRRASAEENELLDKIAEATKRGIEERSSVKVDIVYDRLNRRKIDLIPEWPDPPKSRIGELGDAVERRLVEGGFKEGLHGAFELAVSSARDLGLPAASITSDVKHIEVGLSDKGDSIAWMLWDLVYKKDVRPKDVLIVGDEFGPVAGFEGSDYLMYLPAEMGMTYVSVGPEPNGSPQGVIHVGGGPECFVEMMRHQHSLWRRLSPTGDRSFLLVERGYNPLREREIESLLAIGNGYLGTRGSLGEQPQESDPSTFIAGVYDRAGPSETEELVVLPDWMYVRVYVNGKSLELTPETMFDHRRVLDMKKGLFRREWRHRDEEGRVTSLSFLRFASLADPHTLALRVSVTAENYAGQLRVETGIKVCRDCVPSFVDLKAKTVESEALLIAGRTTYTGVRVAMAQAATAGGDRVTREDDEGVFEAWTRWLEPGERIVLRKKVAVYTSYDTDDPSGMAAHTVIEAARAGFGELMIAQVEAWADRWRDSHIAIDGDPHGQRWINFAGYHLISAGTHGGHWNSIGARALTGAIYKGHIFWDTELFILPFFIYSDPSTARDILEYRYHTLPGARRKAAEFGCKGALFAWESASTGDEMTPPFAYMPTGELIPILSGKLEQHIDAAVAYGVWSYWQATGDDEFLLDAGVELLVETARFWASRVTEAHGTFHINNAEGPDEYHEGVNDSMYVNWMARWNLERAVEAVEYVRTDYPGRWLGIARRLRVEDKEAEEWQAVARKIYGDMDRPPVLEQFKGYFGLEDVDLTQFEPRRVSIDLILGRERVAGSQIIKQADVVMLLYLLEDCFSPDELRANYDFYEHRTAHGSSLSPGIYGLVSARLGLLDRAVRYFEQAGTIDLENNMGNSAGGVHAAALGGFWQMMVMGFGGLRARVEGLAFSPHLPDEWRGLSFRLRWRGGEVDFKVTHEDGMTVKVLSGPSMRIGVWGHDYEEVTPGTTLRSTLDGETWGPFVRSEEERAA